MGPYWWKPPERGEKMTDEITLTGFFRGVRIPLERKLAADVARLEARVAELEAVLKEIMEVDENPDSHPCGPKSYGYFGTIARAALAKLKE